MGPTPVSFKIVRETQTDFEQLFCLALIPARERATNTRYTRGNTRVHVGILRLSLR